MNELEHPFSSQITVFGTWGPVWFPLFLGLVIYFHSWFEPVFLSKWWQRLLGSWILAYLFLFTLYAVGLLGDAWFSSKYR